MFILYIKTYYDGRFYYEKKREEERGGGRGGGRGMRKDEEEEEEWWKEKLLEVMNTFSIDCIKSGVYWSSNSLRCLC